MFESHVQPLVVIFKYKYVSTREEMSVTVDHHFPFILGIRHRCEIGMIACIVVSK